LISLWLGGAIFDLQAYVVEKSRIPKGHDIAPDNFDAVRIAWTRRNPGEQRSSLYTSVAYQVNTLDEVFGLGVFVRLLSCENLGCWYKQTHNHDQLE
jgi:hypothetical protein